jgi:cell division protein FtsA
MNDILRRPPPLSSTDLPPRARARPSGVFGVLDIGSTKITCMIGRGEPDGTRRILGFGWQKGRGVRHGAITDLDEAERAIRAAVGQAEDMADTRLRAVTVNLGCGQPESRLFNVQWPVDGRVVEEDDIRQVVLESRRRAYSEGRDAIHVLPLSFSVDETMRVEDPRGLHCETLTARVHVIDAVSSSLRNLETCLTRCDLELSELVSAPFAAGLATLVEDERELGTTVIDMGGGATSFAVFAENQLLHTSSTLVGGIHVTNDIARLLSTPVAHAERLKTLYGSCQASPDDEREMLPVPLVGEEEHQIARVPRSMVVSIIRPRLEEIFEIVKDRLENSGLSRVAGARVVLTGGACQLAGARELAAHILGKQVRLGRPVGLHGLPDAASGPAFATGAGLLAWAAGEGRAMQDIDLETRRPSGPLRRFISFLKERI